MASSNDNIDYRNWIVDTLTKLDERSQLLLDNFGDHKTRIILCENNIEGIKSRQDKLESSIEKNSSKIHSIDISVADLNRNLNSKHDGYSWLANVGWGFLLIVVSTVLSIIVSKMF